MKTVSMFTMTAAVLAGGHLATAADHIDGPITIADKVADITDMFIFPSPENPSNLVMIMNSHPLPDSDSHFSDRVAYNFDVRRVSQAGTGINTGFNLHEAYNFSCTFATPEEEHHAPEQITCTGPNGLSATAEVEALPDEGAEAAPFKVFAGRRSDPFVNALFWFSDIVLNNKIPPQAHNINDLEDTNVLSIVLEFDTEAAFNLEHGTLFALAGETLAKDEADGRYKRVDRAGQPEITNTRLIGTEGQERLRDGYNAEANFDTTSANFDKYRQRFMESITYYDNLDGIQDWPAEWRPTLVELMVNDYLVVDVAKPYNGEDYLSIENAMLRNQPHTRSGGRSPAQNTINQLFTVLINGGHGPEINSGVEAPEQPMQNTFPYLNEPASGFFAWLKRVLGGPFGEELAMELRK